MTSYPVAYIAAQGDGVVLREGDKPVFVAGVAPGDSVEIEASGQIVSIKPGPNRASSACSHFSLQPGQGCGGCSLQHVALPAYHSWIADRIMMALNQQGIAVQQVMPSHLSLPGTRRRANLRALRTGRHVQIGFNVERAHRLVDLGDCAILHPSLFALLAPLRELFLSTIPEGRVATVQMTLTQSGVDMVLGGLIGKGLEFTQHLTDFAEQCDLARLCIQGPVGLDVIVERRAPIIHLGGCMVRVPPGAFLQATQDGQEALISAVQEAVGKGAEIADLFCGLGTFALPLAQGAKVHAVDAGQSLIHTLERAAKENQRPLTVEHRDLFRRPLIVQELKRFGAVVFDPPRAGAKEQVEQIVQSAVDKVVAVSCNPNTFARDAKMLIDGGYSLSRLWPVGQFLWSTHIELAAEFQRI